MQGTVARSRTALHRRSLSRPVRLAIEQDALRALDTIFDYGCGRGGDLAALMAAGYKCAGWDPAFRPEAPMLKADVVNLGYVINVIENPTERRQVLAKAWSLARRLLIVSARLVHEEKLRHAGAFRDGVMTARGTFQRFYEQAELKAFIETGVGNEAVAASPGVFYVFRNDDDRSAFLRTRQTRRLAVPNVDRSQQLWLEHRGMLEPLVDFYAERGRFPIETELSGDLAIDLRRALGSLRRACGVVAQATGADWITEVRARRADDLLVYLALSNFGGRPRAGSLSEELRQDVKALFANYKTACAKADALLFQAGDESGLEEAMQSSPLGKFTPAALYVHTEFLAQLPPVLRVYEGCARTLVGEVEEATVIKLARGKFQVSYLSYPTFFQDPHPALEQSVVVKLQDLSVRYRFFSQENPPVLHRKEAFIAAQHPAYRKFERLTLAEERAGVLEDGSRIGTKQEWARVLSEHGVALRGHRLIRRSG